MNNKKINIFILLTSILTIILLISPVGIELLNARPGGGHSFSGGGGSSGGGGGDGIGYLIYIILAELPPQISIPLIIAIIVIRFIIIKRNKKESQTITSSPGVQAVMNRTSNIEKDISILKAHDPNFSKILFIDFAASIYNKYYAWFGTKEFNNLSPFFDTSEIQKSSNLRNQQSVNEIVIGSIKISEINNLQHLTGISVDIEANYTLDIHGKKTRYSVVERWYFNRTASILSPEPDKMRKLVCPNCAAPAHFTDTGVCESCGTKINTGEMQWFVKKHYVLSQEVFNAKGLAYYAPERGTNLPTVYQSGLNATVSNFSVQHNIDWNIWSQNYAYHVVSKYFIGIYSAWSKNRLDEARVLLSDRIFESFMFWMDAYKSAGYTNKLENIKINDVQFVRLDSDRFYEAITVRIFANSLDYVTDKQGKLIGGSDKRPRSYSEYWTFVRKNGVEKDEFDYNTCPNCGAPADKMGQAGVCEYCGTKISNGDFSWVLAIITQDEVYSG